MFAFLFKGQDHFLPEAEEITMISIQLAARFLLTTGFHTKRVVRGPASDWYMVLDFGHILEFICLFITLRHFSLIMRMSFEMAKMK